jgi:antitoxin HicB
MAVGKEYQGLGVAAVFSGGDADVKADLAVAQLRAYGIEAIRMPDIGAHGIGAITRIMTNGLIRVLVPPERLEEAVELLRPDDSGAEPAGGGWHTMLPRGESHMDRTYTVVLLKEDVGGYSVLVPALPGCVTQGENLAEALERVKEAIEGYLECLEEHGEPITEDTALVSFQFEDASEALVCKVTVQEALAIA